MLVGQSSQVSKLVMNAWADNTKTSYNTYLKQWGEFCVDKGIPDPYKGTFAQGAEFSAFLHLTKGMPFGTCAVARSALSAILPKEDGCSFGENEVVSKLMRGVFKSAPSLPKQVVIWDPVIMLGYLNSLPNNEELLLERLTKKLCTLLALLSGARSQTIASLNFDFFHLDPSKSQLTFYIAKVLKTTRPGKHQAPLEFLAFPRNRKWCPIDCFTNYFDRTRLIRENANVGNGQLVISYHAPFGPVTSSTVCRYVKLFLGEAGIDITAFTAHSTRSSSTSKAKAVGLNLKDIIKAAGWRSEHCFRKHYDLPLKANFGLSALNN